MTKGHEAELSPILKEFSSWAAAEPSHTGQSLLDTWMERDVVRMQVFAQMRDYPVLLCPVASIPAFRHGERSWQVEGKTVKYLDAWSYTEWFNLLGTPAVVGAGGEVAGRPAHRSADRGASVARGVGDFGGCGFGKSSRLLRASGNRVDGRPAGSRPGGRAELAGRPEASTSLGGTSLRLRSDMAFPYADHLWFTCFWHD